VSRQNDVTIAPDGAGPRRRRVVVVGGGFGGLTAARELGGADVDVTLCAGPAEREAWMTFVVVGGGATGVEIAGQLRSSRGAPWSATSRTSIRAAPG